MIANWWLANVADEEPRPPQHGPLFHSFSNLANVVSLTRHYTSIGTLYKINFLPITSVRQTGKPANVVKEFSAYNIKFKLGFSSYSYKNKNFWIILDDVMIEFLNVLPVCSTNWRSMQRKYCNVGPYQLTRKDSWRPRNFVCADFLV